MKKNMQIICKYHRYMFFTKYLTMLHCIFCVKTIKIQLLEYCSYASTIYLQLSLTRVLIQEQYKNIYFCWFAIQDMV